MALAGRVRPVTLRAACCGWASPGWCRVPGRDGTGTARQPPAKRVVTPAARHAQAWPAPGVRSLPRGERQLAWAPRQPGRFVRRRGCHLVTSVGRGQVSWKPGLAYTMPAWLPTVHSPCRERVVPSTGTIMSWETTSWEQNLFPRGAMREPPALHLGGTRQRRRLMSAGSVLARLRCSRSAQRRGVAAQRVADLELIAAHARVVDFQRPAGWTACQAHDPQQCHARSQSEPARFSG